MSPLRRVLSEVRAAHGSSRVEEIAARAGVAVDEARAAIDFWVARGALTREPVSGGCPLKTDQSCGGCPLRRQCAGPGKPLLFTVRPKPDAA